MARKTPLVPQAPTGTLTHSPFAKIADNAQLVAGLAPSPAPRPPSQPRPPKHAAPCKIRLRMESRGRSGKVVTRISGLPAENLDAIASRLRRGLGCGASVERGDVILQGSLAERASEWLDRAGDLRALREEPNEVPQRRSLEAEINMAAPREAAPDPTGSFSSGSDRAAVRPGLRVAIVQKADQRSGRLTEGVVAHILTNSPTHPRGIKVRLESGEVGRVKVVY